MRVFVNNKEIDQNKHIYRKTYGHVISFMPVNNSHRYTHCERDGTKTMVFMYSVIRLHPTYLICATNFLTICYQVQGEDSKWLKRQRDCFELAWLISPGLCFTNAILFIYVMNVMPQLIEFYHCISTTRQHLSFLLLFFQKLCMPIDVFATL